MVNGYKPEPFDVIHVNHYLHAQRIADKLRKPYSTHYDRCISRTVRGELVGGVVYQHYTGVSIHMHVAGFAPRWVTRNALFAAFYYPFDQLRVRQVLGVVPESNVQAMSFDLGLGFCEIARLPDIVPHGDVVILSMRREQCRWLNWRPRGLTVIQHVEFPYGQPKPSPAATRFN